MWNLPGPGIEPVSPAMAGGFLTTALPGKSLLSQSYLSSSQTPSTGSPNLFLGFIKLLCLHAFCLKLFGLAVCSAQSVLPPTFCRVMTSSFFYFSLNVTQKSPPTLCYTILYVMWCIWELSSQFVVFILFISSLVYCLSSLLGWDSVNVFCVFFKLIYVFGCAGS